MHITFNVEISYDACLFNKDINRGTKKIYMGKLVDATRNWQQFGFGLTGLALSKPNGFKGV